MGWGDTSRGSGCRACQGFPYGIGAFGHFGLDPESGFQCLAISLYCDSAKGVFWFRGDPPGAWPGEVSGCPFPDRGGYRVAVHATALETGCAGSVWDWFAVTGGPLITRSG